MNPSIKPSPALASALGRAIEAFESKPRGETLEEHLAAVLQQALGKLQARSAVDVLTDNALADEIERLR